MLLRTRGVVLLTVLMALFMAGCGDSEKKFSDSSVAAPASMDKVMEAPADSSTPKDTIAEPMPRKIIYTATVEMNTNHFKDSVDRLTQSVKASGGYVAETNITGAADQPKNGVWKVRIPAAQYDGFLAAVGGIGEVTSSSSTSEDVSEEFYDIQARLKNKRIEEARLLQHLQSSTGKLSEILTVEKEISRVREEIERMEGRVRFLSHQTDFTTVTINIHELQSLHLHENSPSFGTQIGRAFTASLAGLGTFTKSLVLVIVYMLPWLVIVAGIGLPISMIVKKRRAQHIRENLNTSPK